MNKSEHVLPSNTVTAVQSIKLVPICSLADAKKHLEEIRRYFESCAHTTDSDFSAINHLDSAFTKAAGKKQSVIADYFQPSL